MHSSQSMSSDSSSPDPLAPARNGFLDVIDAVPASAYVGIDALEDLPGAVYFPTLRWVRRFFREARSPLQQSDVEWAYHCARRDADAVDFDLLRHRYAVDGVSVTIIECAGFLYAEVAAEAMSDEAAPPVERLASVATFLLSPTAGPFSFAPIAGEEARRSFSTNPQGRFESMTTWTDRIDGVVTRRTVGVVLYKVSIKHNDILKHRARWIPDWFREDDEVS